MSGRMSAPRVPTVRPRDTRRSGPKYAGSQMQSPRKWTPDEDELLRVAVQDIGAKHWKLIADRVPGRNHVQCLQRYLRVLQPGLKKGHWTPEEDEKLRYLATRGFTSWIEASEQIPGRSAKQCRDRWRNHLETSIKHGPWEPEEDALLLELHAKHGNRWAAIARCIQGRTENAVKIHCKSLLARKSAIVDGASLLGAANVLGSFENPFETRPEDGDRSGNHGEETKVEYNQKSRSIESDEDAEETADDLSSISPLPSPMGFPSQWMRPWASPTNSGSAGRNNHFSMSSGFQHSHLHAQQQQQQQQQQHQNGVLRAARLQSFPPPILPSNLIMRRSSFPSGQPQQLPQHGSGQGVSSSSSAGRRHLFPPIDTSSSMLYDPSQMMEHIPSPIQSPTNASYGASPTNSFAGSVAHSFNGAVPLNFRLEIPAIIRPSTEVVGDRFFIQNEQ